MPLYSFKDTTTGEVFDKLMTWDDRAEFLEQNKNLTPHIGKAPGLIGGRSMDSGTLPDGFKDKLREMKKKYPTSGGVDHLI